MAVNETRFGLTNKEISSSTSNLTIILGSEMVFYVKMRNYHWNIAGNSFIELHRLIEEQYKKVEFLIDEIAERISKLGGKAIGSMQEFLKNSVLAESKALTVGQKEMLEDLWNDHNTMAQKLREFIETIEDETSDVVTIDFLTSVLASHESMGWMLKKYLS
jgi:starvation-inducible DNA-binding protein